LRSFQGSWKAGGKLSDRICYPIKSSGVCARPKLSGDNFPGEGEVPTRPIHTTISLVHLIRHISFVHSYHSCTPIVWPTYFADCRAVGWLPQSRLFSLKSNHIASGKNIIMLWLRVFGIFGVITMVVWVYLLLWPAFTGTHSNPKLRHAKECRFYFCFHKSNESVITTSKSVQNTLTRIFTSFLSTPT